MGPYRLSREVSRGPEGLYLVLFATMQPADQPHGPDVIDTFIQGTTDKTLVHKPG
jgi:hypothetical protein